MPEAAQETETNEEITVQVSITLSPAELARLDNNAKADERSRARQVAYYVKKAISLPNESVRL